MQGGTHVQHSCVIDIHGLLCVGSAVLVVEVDASIVNEYIDTTILRDFFGKVFDTAAIRNIQLGINDATGGVI